MKERVDEPRLPVRYDNLLAWKKYILKLRSDIENNVQREDFYEIPGPLSDEDAGRVDGLMRNFREAIGQSDEVHLIRTLSAMQKLIKERASNNSVSVGIEGRVKVATEFERIVENSPLNDKLEKGRNGAYVSTFKAGIGPTVKKLIQQVIFYPGKKQKEIDKNIFDDGFVIDGKGITLYNPSMGVDGEFIQWRNTGSLSFSVDAPAILDIINNPRRDLFGRPKAFAPVGVLSIYERAVSTDTESPSKVRVLLESPRDWEELLNDLREKLSVDSNKKSEFKRPISWKHFVRLGLFELDNVPLPRIMDRMLNRIYADYQNEVITYNQEIQRRNSRR